MCACKVAVAKLEYQNSICKKYGIAKMLKGKLDEWQEKVVTNDVTRHTVTKRIGKTTTKRVKHADFMVDKAIKFAKQLIGSLGCPSAPLQHSYSHTTD